MAKMKRLTQEERARREAKRERRATRRENESENRPSSRPIATLADVVRTQSLVYPTSRATRRLIRDAEAHVRETARLMVTNVSCDTCNAHKGCCSLTVVAFFHEAIPIVQRLKEEGRDTAELRAALSVAADEMETRSPSEYRRACAFLDSAERCTIYDQRPSECGTTFVSSPPIQCSDPAAISIQKYLPPDPGGAMEIERTFEREARLAPLRGPYMGTLPRMVLLALEAWDRTDYVDFLAGRIPEIAERSIAAIRR